jgi:hypothetical protein
MDMRKSLLLLACASVGAFAQVEVLEEPKRVSKVETSLSLGLADYKEKVFGKTWYASLNVDYRAKYPFLVGAGLSASSSSDVFMLYPSLRFKVRVPVVSTLKVDPFVSVNMGYAENKTIHKKKLIAGGSAGIEVLYFFGNSYAGVRVGYGVFSDSRFNHLFVGGIIGF